MKKIIPISLTLFGLLLAWWLLNYQGTYTYERTNTTPETAPGVTEPEFTPEKIGQLFMIGHWAGTPVASTTELIAQYQIGGVIIMSAPEDPTEIKSWVKDWQSVSSSTLFIAIDQEGGPVSRLKGAGYTQTSQQEITDAETAYRVGKKRGEELAALGINMNFAPVLDTAKNPDSFMYERVFPTSTEASALASAMIDGLKDSGVIAVTKHFPGHDDTAEDSHTVLPEIALNRSELDDFTTPFAKLIKDGSTQAMMTAHVAFPLIDSLPATLSPFFLTKYLRGTLGFTGIIVTDDMIMDAIDTTWPHQEATVMSLRAGASMILYAAEPQMVEAAILNTNTELIADPSFKEQLAASYLVIQNLKNSR